MSLTIKSKKGHFTGHEAILNHFCRYGKTVAVNLVNGAKLVGKVKAFDNFTISLQRDGDDYPIVIFKSAVVYFFSKDTSEFK